MGLYNYALGSRDTATGTVAHSNTTALVGTGTAFTTELSVGDVIEVAGVYRLVSIITDDTHLTVGTAYDDTVSGEDLYRFEMVNIEDFGVPGETGRGANVPTPAPKSAYWPWSLPLSLASGGVRAAGWPRAEWHWDFLSLTARDRLSLFCLEVPSIFLAVRTRTNRGGFTGQAVYKTFVGEMLWPAEEPKQAAFLNDFTLRFQALVQLST